MKVATSKFSPNFMAWLLLDVIYHNRGNAKATDFCHDFKHFGERNAERKGYSVSDCTRLSFFRRNIQPVFFPIAFDKNRLKWKLAPYRLHITLTMGKWMFPSPKTLL